jgi:hypothetical protein
MRAPILLIGFVGLFLTQGCAIACGEGDGEERVRASVTVAEPARDRTLSVTIAHSDDPRTDVGQLRDVGRQAWTLTRVEGERADRVREAARASGALRTSDDVVLVYACPEAASWRTITLVSSADDHAFLIESPDGWRRVKAETFEEHHHSALKSVVASLVVVTSGLVALPFDIVTLPISLPIVIGGLCGGPAR